MFTNILLSAGMLILASLVPPDVNKLDVLFQTSGLCPSGTPIELTVYKMAGDEGDTPVVLAWSRGGLPLAALDRTSNRIYIYKEKKEYPLDELMERYPTPCDIPHSDL